MDTLSETLWHEFAVETDEHLQAVEPILAQADPQRTSAADIAQLFRSFHSVKGLARAMDMVGMEGMAHHAEDLLGLVRDGRAALTPELAELLLQSVDALKRMRDVVTEQRHDTPPDRDLLARLAAAFAQAGGTGANEVPQPHPAAAAEDTLLHEDPEMLAIFVEMVQARGPELCAALAADADERASAINAAETLAHAAEVMNFDALSASFVGLLQALQTLSPTDGIGESARHDLLSRLGDIRLQIELVGEITGLDAGAEGFSDALAGRVGDERHRLAASLAVLNQELREDLAEGDRLAGEVDAAAIVRQVRTLHGMTMALSLARTAEIILLIEDLYGRVASGDIEPSETLVDAADEVFSCIAGHAAAGRIGDFADDEAARLVDRLRAPLISAAQKISLGEGSAGLIAGLAVPSELLDVLSDENLAELEQGIGQDGLLPYEILLHLEADPEIAARLIGWLTGEGRAITNRTVVTDDESWFEFLLLSPLEPAALAASLLRLDPDRRCVKRVRRLTDVAGGVLVLAQSGEAGGEATAPAIAAAGATLRPAAATNLIRVRGEIVDAYLDDIGELRVMAGALTHLIRGGGSDAMLASVRGIVERLPPGSRNELTAVLNDFRERDRRLLETEELIAGLLSRLHQSALELRVVPVDVVFTRLPRMVRDFAQQHGKSVELVLEGRDVRIDKSMVEALADPLIHMVRNALDHGIETPEERRNAGKPERAQLTLRATQHASEVHIEIADDGRGLDPDAIRAKAVARNLITPAQAAALSDAEAFQFIFEAGLSTAQAVTETSGRGVGMDVVLTTVRRLSGDIKLRSERGLGTLFTLVLPVSAALQTALIVRVGEQSLAIPERHVLSVAEIETDAITLIGDHRSILHRQAVLPLYDLGQLLGLPSTAPPVERTLEPVIVTTNGRQMIGLEVDAIERRQELFLKDLDPRLARFPGIGGASVLGDGRVVLVLDGEELIQLAARGVNRALATAARTAS
jgi:two-component system, chemotaxis family, sensor kinase CheA